jgi:putative spermidine/putrescine transport system permease protein
MLKSDTSTMRQVRRIPRSIRSIRTGLVILLLLSPTLALSSALFLGPLLESLLTSLRASDGGLTLAHYQHILTSHGYRTDFIFTLAVSLGTVLVCTLITLPLALVLRRPFRGRGALWLIALLPFVTPHVVAAYALRLTLSPASPFLFWLPQGGAEGIALVNAWPGLLIALTWKFFPVLLLTLTAALQGLPPGYEEAARDLGAGWWRRLRAILLPLIAPGWLAGATLVFVLAASQFTITLIIYGGQRVTTIPLGVYFETFSSRRPGIAAALGLVLLLVTLLIVAITAWWVRAHTQRWSSGGLVGLGARSQIDSTAMPRSARLWCRLVITGTLLFVLGPVLCLILTSFSGQWLGGTPLPTQYTLRWYSYLFRYENGLAALGQSTWIALATTFLTTAAAVPASYALARYQFWGRDLIEHLFLAKTATPIIVIAVGTAVLFYRWQLTDTFIGIVLAHSVGALPLAVRSITATFERTDRVQEEAARDMGAGPLRRFFSIVLPGALSGIMSGAALAFLFSMDEFTVTFLISGVQYTTLPLRLYSALNQGYIEPAAAAAVILLVPSLLFLGLLLRLFGTDHLARVSH